MHLSFLKVWADAQEIGWGYHSSMENTNQDLWKNSQIHKNARELTVSLIFKKNHSSEKGLGITVVTNNTKAVQSLSHQGNSHSLPLLTNDSQSYLQQRRWMHSINKLLRIFGLSVLTTRHMTNHAKWWWIINELPGEICKQVCDELPK